MYAHGKAPMCSSRLTEVSLTLPLNSSNVVVFLTRAHARPHRESVQCFLFLRFFFSLQAINGVMSLALRPQVASQAPQYLKIFSKLEYIRGNNSFFFLMSVVVVVVVVCCCYFSVSYSPSRKFIIIR